MRYARTCLIIMMLAGRVLASAQEHSYSVMTFGAFTTSSKLFPNSNDANEFTRGQFLPLDDIFSVGFEIRREIAPIRTQVGFSIEYIKTSDLRSDSLSSATTVPVTDGFTVVPIELSGYFLIPFSSETVQLFIGGGVGMYPGARTYKYADVNAGVINHSLGVGIHVVSGLEYNINKSLSLRSMIKFRDVQFESVNRFTQPSTTYNGTTVYLSQDPLTSRINVDGMMITLGVVVHF